VNSRIWDLAGGDILAELSSTPRKGMKRPNEAVVIISIKISLFIIV